jgi:hypothetical protein
MSHSPEWIGPDAPDPAALPQLTALEAFDAMRAFVEGYWEQGGKAEEEIRRLLSALNRDRSIWPDGCPADPAVWPDWLRAVEAIKGETSSDS